MRKSVLDQLFVNRFRGPKAIRKVLDAPKAQPRDLPSLVKRRPRTATSYIKGVHNGNYYRIRIPPKKERPTSVQKLPTPTAPPKAFKNPPPSRETIAAAKTTASSGEGARSSWTRQRVNEWLKANWAILVLNFGSICTLTGFTRSDVLELRMLSMTGSLSSIVYLMSHKQILWASVGWSSTFASVNAYKISQILHERNAEVHMTDKQEEVFVEHFMPHGVTPKQFERIDAKAQCVKIEKGEFLIKLGDKLDHVFLIVEGSTQAHVLGRSLTAASTTPQTKGSQKVGGNSGVWVGEMAFLHQLAEKEKAKIQKPSSNQQSTSVDHRNAIYSIVAKEDCTVMAWSHEDLEDLMKSSTDLRAAITRAMTTALVGKVVNLTVSRSASGLPNWSAWLSDWKRMDGASVQVKGIHKLPEDNASNREITSIEDLPEL